MDALEILKNSLAYGDLYKVDIENNTFVFRCLTRKEYSRLLELSLDQDTKEELVCRLCVISPPDFDYSATLAGVVTTLASTILRVSGFPPAPSEEQIANGPPELKQQYEKDVNDIIQRIERARRQIAEDLERKIEAVILAAFPGLTLEYLDNLPFDSWLRYMAAAEFVLTAIHGIPSNVLKQIYSVKKPPSVEEQLNEMSKEKYVLKGKIPGWADTNELPQGVRDQAELQKLIDMIYSQNKNKTLL